MSYPKKSDQQKLQIVPFSNKHTETMDEADHESVTYVFDYQKHASTLSYNLSTLQQHNVLDDVTLIGKRGKRFTFHSVLLASASPFFRHVFCGTTLRFHQGEFVPLDVDPMVLFVLQKYIYRRSPATAYSSSLEWNDLLDFASVYGFESMLSGFAEPEDQMEALSSMWINHELTNTVVKVGNEDFPCHDCVFAASSPVIFNLFKSHPLAKFFSRTVQMNGVDGIAWHAIIKFIYTAKLQLNDRNVGTVMQAASFLKFPGISWACVDYIVTHLTPDNCLGCLEYARTGVKVHRDDFYADLSKRCREHVVKRFSDVIHHEEFLSYTTEEEIIDYMLETEVKSLDYSKLLTAFLDWYNFSQSDRQEKYARLVTAACFLLNRNGFAQVVQKVKTFVLSK